MGDLPNTCSVNMHEVDLEPACSVRLKREMSSVGSPSGALIVSRAIGQLHDLTRGDVHEEDVKAGRSWRSPREGEEPAIGRPSGRISEASAIEHAAKVRSIGVYDIDLWRPAAVGDEGDLSPRSRVPSRGRMDNAALVGELADDGSIG